MKAQTERVVEEAIVRIVKRFLSLRSGAKDGSHVRRKQPGNTVTLNRRAAQMLTGV